MHLWVFEHRSGRLHREGRTGPDMDAFGYSGYREGKNNTLLQDVPEVGPIPCGIYRIGKVHDSQKTGPCTIPLTPVEGFDIFNRSDFAVHGDSISDPGEASRGCIIQGRALREYFALDEGGLLAVVSGR